MATEKRLKTQERELQRQLRDVRDALDDVVQKKEIPALKKQYLGKYFVFDNSNGTSHWNVYYRVVEIKSNRYARAVKIETEPDWDTKNKIDFKISIERGEISYTLFNTEISEEM